MNVISLNRNDIGHGYAGELMAHEPDQFYGNSGFVLVVAAKGMGGNGIAGV